LASSSKSRAGLDKVTVLPAVCTRYGSEIFRHDMMHHDTLAGSHQQILRSKTCGKRKKTASFCRFIGHLRLTSCENAAQVVQLSHLWAGHGRTPWRVWPSSHVVSCHLILQLSTTSPRRGCRVPQPKLRVGSSPFTIFTSQSYKALRDSS